MDNISRSSRSGLAGLEHHICAPMEVFKEFYERQGCRPTQLLVSARGDHGQELVNWSMEALL
jgi:hypothetical protein